MAILQDDLNPWGHMPYSYEAGSQYASGQSAAAPDAKNGGQGIMSAIAPMLGSMLAPNQSAPAQSASPPAPQPQPQYVFGSEGGEESQSRPFADRIGQSVLAASQAAVAKQGGGMQKKKLGQGSGQGADIGYNSGGIMGGEV